MADVSVTDPNFRAKLLRDNGFKDEEVAEILNGQYTPTGFPKPVKVYRLISEMYDLSLEEHYYWVLDQLKDNFPLIEKLEDSFAAAENSAFFGATQLRLGGQQDKISQFLATTGKMIKELFQMVRELRILDERLKYYEGVAKQLERPLAQREKNDEVTLKGIFVDLVQQGSKSAASVFGMAQQLEFITLPDLFFDAPPFKDDDEMNNHVRSLSKDFNENVLRVLIRHLNHYKTWRDTTFKEHAHRKKFMLAYLQQHYDIIKMYVTWLKPYLRNVEKLSLKEKSMRSADIVASFEGSMLDIEILASKQTASKKVGEEEIKGFDCILATFNFRTRPELKVVQEGYQRGPVHIGRMELTLRVYRWTNEDITNYKKFKDQESLAMFGDVSGTVQGAMEALGNELTYYLDQAKGLQKKDEKKEAPKAADKKGFMEKFLGDFYTPKKKEDKEIAASEENKKAIMDEIRKGKPQDAIFQAWITFNVFKKSHRMIAW